MVNVAVLITCHNRKLKTLNCLHLFEMASKPSGHSFEIFLVDDGSTDGTGPEVRHQFPNVKLINGSGQLFWAGGMRLAWETAMQTARYESFLLLNDDVELDPDFIFQLLGAKKHANRKGKLGIYVGQTINKKGEVTYGGRRITKNHFLMKYEPQPISTEPVECNMANANILWVDAEVVKSIGIFDNRFTHGIADFDFTLSAARAGFALFVAAGVGGICEVDHAPNWRGSSHSLGSRIKYLMSPKGLAYHEYLYYIRKHFPLYLPYAWSMLWLKTFFPFFWVAFKQK